MEDNRSYDLVILGGGAAAFAAITEASGRGLSTAIVNTGLPIGGTCVNVGCVPSKHLLAVGESAAAPQKNPFEAVQYSDDEPTVDWDEALDGTDALVERFRQENYVDVAEHFETDIYEGYGELVDDTTIEIVDGPDRGYQDYRRENVGRDWKFTLGTAHRRARRRRLLHERNHPSGT